MCRYVYEYELNDLYVLLFHFHYFFFLSNDALSSVFLFCNKREETKNEQL